MPVFTSIGAIEQHFKAIARDAVEEATENGYRALEGCLQSFYGGGSPTMYSRTDNLGSSARRSGVSAGGAGASSEVYIDLGSGYGTGTYSKWDVVSEAEVGGSGIKGLGGFWARYESQQQMLLNAAVASRI